MRSFVSVACAFLALASFGMVSAPAFASDAVNSGDTAWILTATALVLFMTLPGLALVYAGLVQSKNIVSVLMHHFAIACLMSILWVIAGYSLAFSGDGAWFGDLGNLFMGGIGLDSMSGTIPESVFAAFQMTFAVITPALVIGAYVERMKFSAVLLFSGIWLLVVYAPVTHWVWGGGVMAAWGVMDFAGGIVVHATAGTAALVCALVLGKRRNFPESVTPPHSPVLTMIGASMLMPGPSLVHAQPLCEDAAKRLVTKSTEEADLTNQLQVLALSMQPKECMTNLKSGSIHRMLRANVN